MKSIVSFTLTTLSLSFALHAFASEAPHWGYEGSEGPSQWGDLSSEYSECKLGRNQSPINITHAVKGDLTNLSIDYKAGGDRIINNGHTVQVNYEPGSTLTLDGHTYELKQFHFHTPSENEIDGKHYPMEGHFVHADKEGNLAVLAVMFDGTNTNPELAKAWSQMPSANDGEHTLATAIDANQLLPTDHSYYRFNGSLTTPPCSEGVVWLMMKNQEAASSEQVSQLHDTLKHDNNRPVQPLNARVVLQ